MPPRFSAQPKLRLIAAVVALGATVPVGGADAETIPRVPCAASGNAGKSWQTFKSPTFVQPAGLGAQTQDITAYAVAPSRPTLMAVTNGNAIYISTDGGCAWDQSLRLDQIPSTPGIPLSGQVTKIRGLYILPKTNRIIALAEELETGATVGRPHVLINDSGNRADWRLGDEGLPPVGSPVRIRAHSDSPNVVYLSFANAKAPEGGPGCPPAPLPCPGAEDAGTPGLLWGSSDGGRTWSRRSDPNDLNGAAVIRYFSVDDDDRSGRTLWVVSGGRLRKSTNGGASYSYPDGLREDVQSGFNFTAVESIDQPTKLPNPVRVLAFSSGGEMMRLEDRKGWVRSKIPFSAVESVSQRADGDIVVATTPSAGSVTVWRVYPYTLQDLEIGDPDSPQRFKLTYGWQNITPNGVTVAAKVSSAAAGSQSTYFLRDRRRILRFLGTAIRLPVPEAPPELTGAPPPPQGRIDPHNKVFPVPLGKTHSVDYTVTLPAAPTPIDIYLLIDNSGSMQPLIDALKEALGDVAVSLLEAKIDVNIGVGQINVQPDRQEVPIDNPETENIDESKPRPVYQRLRAIGRVDPALFRALSTIDGYGGSGDEAQLEALWQSVTGDGYEPLGLGPVTGYNVERGQDARWRSGSDKVRVIVHATDEAFSRNIRGGHNDPAVVAAALNNMGIRQIGLSQDVPDAHRDLEDMARRTGALAPPGGTDCDGNGRPDIKAGEPLVCGQNYGLDKTLVNLIKSLGDVQDLTVGITGPGKRSLNDVTFSINAKAPEPMKFRVTYSCVGVAPGAYTHDIRAGLRDLIVARTTTTIECGTVPRLPERPEVGGNQPPQPPPLQPQPVPAPIAPVQPVPQPQTQVQGQPQVNPQAGAAQQKQRQLQVAVAENDLGLRDEDSLAMVGLSSEERAVAPATAVLIAGMAMASACAGAFAYRRRTQPQVARARVG